jgi:hypothetical protein
LTTEKVEIFHRNLSTMTIQDTLNEGNGRFDPLVISLFENNYCLTCNVYWLILFQL